MDRVSGSDVCEPGMDGHIAKQGCQKEEVPSSSRRQSAKPPMFPERARCLRLRCGASVVAPFCHGKTKGCV